MAETQTGVTQTGAGRGRRGGGGLKGFYRRNKLAVLGGGGLLAFLFMGHKGGKGGGATDQTAQQSALNQEQQALAQEQAALESGNLVPGGYDSGLGSGGAGGGADNSGAGAGGTLVGDPGTAGGSAGSQDPTSNQGAGQIGPINVTVNNPAAKKHPGNKGAKTTHPGMKPKPGKAPKPKTAPRGKPAPASKHPASSGGGRGASGGGRGAARHPAAPQAHHPETPKKTRTGAKKRSPAEVESVSGFGAGIVVMGREFPGALSHRMGPPRRDPIDGMCRTVTLDYGGRTETHMVHGDGSRWTDNLAGANPPSRGVPMAMSRDDAR